MLPKENPDQNVGPKKQNSNILCFTFGDFFIPKKKGIGNIIFKNFHNCAKVSQQQKINVCSEFHSQIFPFYFQPSLLGWPTPPPRPPGPKYISKLNGEENGAPGQWA
jgi:hypothetical protein